MFCGKADGRSFWGGVKPLQKLLVFGGPCALGGHKTKQKLDFKLDP